MAKFSWNQRFAEVKIQRLSNSVQKQEYCMIRSIKKIYTQITIKMKEGKMLIHPATNRGISADTGQSKIRTDSEQNILLEMIREGEIGRNYDIKTPFGYKPLIYSDYIASGRCLSFIENYIQTEIMPLYGNTHSDSSSSSIQTSYYREEARAYIKTSTNSNHDDLLIFTSNGATGAINELIHLLGIKEIVRNAKITTKLKNLGLSMENIEEFLNIENNNNYCSKNRWGSYDCTLCQMPFEHIGLYQEHSKTQIHLDKVKLLPKSVGLQEIPIVFLSVMEHNSNLLPWRESGVEIEMIGMDENGHFDYNELVKKLEGVGDSGNRLKIGSFSSGSNITGLSVDIGYVSEVLHRHNCVIFQDCAATAPYSILKMNGDTYRKRKEDIGENPGAPNPKIYLDGMFISPHKFIGGPGCSGVLLVKKNLINNNSPFMVGGGTIFNVGNSSHSFSQNLEEREEGGTPNILGCIKAGLVFQLKDNIGVTYIQNRETQLYKTARIFLQKLPNVDLIGSYDQYSLPIFSFNIKCFEGKYLHYNYVCKLANDLFGIQMRGGCSCASLYAQQALGIDHQLFSTYNQLLLQGYEIMRIGFVRFNLIYFISDEEVNYILNAIKFISEFGWIFLPYYEFQVHQLIWNHRLFDRAETRRQWFGHINYSEGRFDFEHNPSFKKNSNNLKMDFNELIQNAYSAIKTTTEEYKIIYGKTPLDQRKLFSELSNKYRWFILPTEIFPYLAKYQNLLLEENYEELSNLKHELNLPFKPLKYKKLDAQSKVSEKEDYYQLKEEQKHVVVKDGNEENVYEEEEENIFSFDALPLLNEELNVKQKVTVPGSILNIPKEISKLVGEAICDFNMIKEGDRILIGVSGGKDSLSLFHILSSFQKKAPIRFSIGVATVDPQAGEFDPRPLIGYFNSLSVRYHQPSENIVSRAHSQLQGNSMCAFCSRMRRGILYTCCRKYGYNVIALGQHLDDLAESFIMSVFHNGRLRTMKANYLCDKGDIRVIRPLVYCRENLFLTFARENHLPVITDNCPACFAAPKERKRIKHLLAQQQHYFPNLFQSILKSIKPIMISDNSADLNNGMLDEDEQMI